MKHESELLRRIEIRYDFVKGKLANHVIDENSCWNYQGSTRNGGYGHFQIYVREFEPKRRKFAAHRVSYALFNRVDPGEKFVCHRCDNPLCINPDHLFLGSHKDNMQDMVLKGRRAETYGESNPAVKLKESEVREIISRIIAGETNKAIAEDFSITHSQVSLIRLGKQWVNVSNDMDHKPRPVFERSSQSRL